MLLEANVRADSINDRGKRLITVEFTHARFVLAEVNTHRALSKNGASSRAIPFSRQLEDILANTAEPVVWGREQRGMQASAFLTEEEIVRARAIWFEARDDAIRHAMRLTEMGVHKQIANRLVEPFKVQRTLLSGTDWENFKALRCHADADPTFRASAELVREAIEASKPIYRSEKDEGIEAYHLPYITEDDKTAAMEAANAIRLDWDAIDQEELAAFEALRPFAPILNVRIAVLLSAARAASVSYKTVDGQPMSISKATAIFKKLVLARPVHASPLEHQGKAGGNIQSGNFKGWWQARQFIDGNVVEG